MKNLTLLTVTNKQNSNRGFRLLQQEKEKIKFLDPKISLVDTCESYSDYNKFCILDLDKYFDTEFVLIIQFDGYILNPSAWDNDFLNYDYIGAPWIRQQLNFNRNFESNDYLVGNGGFSLRSKKLYTILHNKDEEYLKVPLYLKNEDIFICQQQRLFLEKNDIKFGKYEVAKKFSVENRQYENQFGCHDSYFQGRQRNKLEFI